MSTKYKTELIVSMPRHLLLSEWKDKWLYVFSQIRMSGGGQWKCLKQNLWKNLCSLHAALLNEQQIQQIFIIIIIIIITLLKKLKKAQNINSNDSNKRLIYIYTYIAQLQSLPEMLIPSLFSGNVFSVWANSQAEMKCTDCVHIFFFFFYQMLLIYIIPCKICLFCI